VADVFDGILGQPKVRNFLRSLVANGAAGQAYLFTGPAGSNKTSAAFALAQALVCPDGACRDCEECRLAQRRKHPDVHFYSPEGDTYLIDQIREIIADTTMAPIRASRKVYILDRADLLGVQPANALLKTLEEPNANVVFILMGRTVDAVLPTIVSRCQVVPFRHIPATEAAGIISQNTGVSAEQARIAIEACDGSITKALRFVRSTERTEYRARVIEVLTALEYADGRDVLDYAIELTEKAQAPLDTVRRTQDRELEESQDYLSRSAMQQLEQRNKRAIRAATRDLLAQSTSIIRSWLRDVLAIVSGTPELVVNVDKRDVLEQAALSADVPALMEALRETYKTDKAIAYTVSYETCFGALLFSIRKALYGTGSTH